MLSKSEAKEIVHLVSWNRHLRKLTEDSNEAELCCAYPLQQNTHSPTQWEAVCPLASESFLKDVH